MSELHAVTGAFGYSGKYIARMLIEQGKRTITLTNSLGRPNPFGDKLAVYPFNFDQPEKLVETLRGVSVLYNTYWVRFSHKNFSHAQAVKNSIALFNCAKKAGVERIVHISITNPSPNSPFEYFRGKAKLEEELIKTGISYAILRPASLFGNEDILLNNIAWTVRRLPVIGYFGTGDYKLQPIHVEDLAHLAVEQGRRKENTIINALGPETYTYKDLLRFVAEVLGKKRLFLPVPITVGYLASLVIGLIMDDKLLTWDELRALTSNLLYVDAQPAGKTKLSQWLQDNSAALGKTYASELARRVR